MNWSNMPEELRTTNAETVANILAQAIRQPLFYESDLRLLAVVADSAAKTQQYDIVRFQVTVTRTPVDGENLDLVVAKKFVVTVTEAE